MACRQAPECGHGLRAGVRAADGDAARTSNIWGGGGVGLCGRHDGEAQVELSSAVCAGREGAFGRQSSGGAKVGSSAAADLGLLLISGRQGARRAAGAVPHEANKPRAGLRTTGHEHGRRARGARAAARSAREQAQCAVAGGAAPVAAVGRSESVERVHGTSTPCEAILLTER